MPAILAWLVSGALWAGLLAVLKQAFKWVISKAPGFLAHVAGAVGIYFVVAEPVADMGLNWVQQQFNGVPGTVLETIYYLDVDNYISAIISAYSARAAGEVMLRKKP